MIRAVKTTVRNRLRKKGTVEGTVAKKVCFFFRLKFMKSYKFAPDNNKT